MIGLKSILTTALALAGLVAAHPTTSLEPRQAAIRPVENPVVVDRGGVYMRAVTLRDGSLLAGYTGFDGPTKFLRVTKSTDGGRSWNIIGNVDQGPGDVRDIDNAFLLALPDGRILYAFRNHSKIAGGEYTWYRITVCVSTDGGATWRFLSHVDEHAHNPNARNGLWEPFLRVTRDGVLQCFYSSENNNGDQDNIMRASYDGGLTWPRIFGMSGGDVNSRDGMIGVAPIDNNGNLIAVFEATATGPFHVDAVFSQDDGFSWNSRIRVYTAANNREAGAPYVANVGGTLIVDFMSNEAGGGPGVDGGEMKAVTSTDGGRTWGPATVIGGLGSHWPGMHVIDDRTFLAFYGGPNGLVSQRWSL